ncbi:MAG: DUF481 domain-containing protein [Candidatus Nitrospinota bacterium M3_3B_026]
MKATRLIAALAAAFAAAIVMASASASLAAEPEEAQRPWKGEVEIGGVATSGNTNTKSLKTKLRVVNEVERLRHNLKADSYYSESSDGSGDDAQRLAVSLNTAYKISRRDHAFVEAGYENDRFSGYKYRVHEAVGLGRAMAPTENILLRVEAGPGGRHSLLDDGSREDEVVFLTGLDFKWRIGESSEFSEELSSVAGAGGTVVEGATAFKTNISGSSLSLKLSMDTRWNSSPPTDKKETDTTTSVTLVYDF